MINPTVEELVNGLAIEVQQWKGTVALFLKASGGSVTIKKADTEVAAPYEIVMKRVDEEKTPDSVEIEFKLLEGKEQIEAVLGKPSPIIIPK